MSTHIHRNATYREELLRLPSCMLHSLPGVGLFHSRRVDGGGFTVERHDTCGNIHVGTLYGLHDGMWAARKPACPVAICIGLYRTRDAAIAALASL